MIPVYVRERQLSQLLGRGSNCHTHTLMGGCATPYGLSVVLR